MPVYNKRGILLLPKVIVLNPKDGHVDGVLLDKEKVNLAYNPNCNTGEWVSGTMPDGSQYIKPVFRS